MGEPTARKYRDRGELPGERRRRRTNRAQKDPIAGLREAAGRMLERHPGCGQPRCSRSAGGAIRVSSRRSSGRYSGSGCATVGAAENPGDQQPLALAGAREGLLPEDCAGGVEDASLARPGAQVDTGAEGRLGMQGQ